MKWIFLTKNACLSCKKKFIQLKCWVLQPSKRWSHFFEKKNLKLWIFVHFCPFNLLENLPWSDDCSLLRTRYPSRKLSILETIDKKERGLFSSLSKTLCRSKKACRWQWKSWREQPSFPSRISLFSVPCIQLCIFINVFSFIKTPFVNSSSSAQYFRIRGRNFLKMKSLKSWFFRIWEGFSQNTHFSKSKKSRICSNVFSLFGQKKTLTLPTDKECTNFWHH